MRVQRRLVILPSIPLNAFSWRAFRLHIVRLDLGELRDAVRYFMEMDGVVNYVRHEPTVRLLNQLLGLDLKPSSDLYTYREGDALLVVSLRNPKRGVEVEPRPEDLDIAYVIPVPTV